MYRFESSFAGIAAAAAFGGLVMLAGCSSDTTGSAGHQMRLSFTTKSSAALHSSAGISQDVVVGPAGELVLKRIQLVIDHVELSPSDATVCNDDKQGGDGEDGGGNDLRGDQSTDTENQCDDISANPILVNVPVDDALHTVVSVPVPAGTFTRLEAKLRPPSAATITTLGAPADMVGRTIRVEGTFKGTPFVFTSELSSNLEFEFNPPLVVDGTGKNATVNIDVTRWFIASGGTVIDPTTANPGGPNESLVANNIRNSFNAFEDDGMKGEDNRQTGNPDR
jgi:hypothetical protein